MVTVSLEEVVQIHAILCRHFEDSHDPVSPPGVKNPDMLASAVYRQETSFGSTLKHPDAWHNAAALMYGLCLNHAFHNGNKRVALVSTLFHLEKNGLVLRGVPHDDLYNLVLEVARHGLGALDTARKARRRAGLPERADGGLKADEEVLILRNWLTERATQVKGGNRPLRFRELRRILSRLGCSISDPKDNFIKIHRPRQIEKPTFFGIRTFRKTVYDSKQIAYSGENEIVAPASIAEIRRDLGLRDDDGIDSAAFYDGEAVVDSIICDYRNILRRLARK